MSDGRRGADHVTARTGIERHAERNGDSNQGPEIERQRQGPGGLSASRRTSRAAGRTGPKRPGLAWSNSAGRPADAVVEESVAAARAPAARGRPRAVRGGAAAARGLGRRPWRRSRRRPPAGAELDRREAERAARPFVDLDDDQLHRTTRSARDDVVALDRRTSERAGVVEPYSRQATQLDNDDPRSSAQQPDLRGVAEGTHRAVPADRRRVRDQPPQRDSATRCGCLGLLLDLG